MNNTLPLLHKRPLLLLGLLVGVVIVGSVLITPPAAHAQEELLTNPGFETGSLGPWTFAENAGTCTVTLQTDNPHSGTYLARFGGFTCTIVTVTQSVVVSQGASYTLSGWTRGSGYTCEMGYGADPHLVGATFGPPTSVFSSPWAQVTETFSWPGRTQAVYVGMWCALERGFESYDDFSLQSVA